MQTGCGGGRGVENLENIFDVTCSRLLNLSSCKFSLIDLTRLLINFVLNLVLKIPNVEPLLNTYLAGERPARPAAPLRGQVV